LYKLRSAIVHGTPGELRSSTQELIDTWPFKTKPKRASDRRTAALSIALTVAQEVIVAALRLATDAEFDPRKGSFPGVLNRAALDSDWRERLQIRAGILPQSATTFASLPFTAPPPLYRLQQIEADEPSP
jgi:hypothetical protein